MSSGKREHRQERKHRQEKKTSSGKRERRHKKENVVVKKRTTSCPGTDGHLIRQFRKLDTISNLFV